MASDPSTYTAGEDIEAGDFVYIVADRLIIRHTVHSDTPEEDTCEVFTLDRAVKRGETITKQVSPLDQKEWAVIYDDGATCDLTHQEARQMCRALAERDINSATIVTNAVGKLARDKGYLRTPDQN